MNTMTSLQFTTAVLGLATCVGSLSAHSRISMTAKAGSSVVLPCDLRNILEAPHLEWRTFKEIVVERFNEELYQGEGYKDRADVPKDELLKGNCSLVLKNVTSADAGVYESYLVVKRTKRSLRSKRVFIQSVELSVDETPEEQLPAKKISPDDTGMNCPHPHVLVVCLLLCLLF